MRSAAALALLGAVTLLVAAGCGRSGEPRGDGLDPAAEGSGYFVGGDSSGLGAAVDFRAIDPTILDLRSPRHRTRATAHLATVALVNRSDHPQPRPAFIAVFPRGGAVPLEPVGPSADAPARPLPAGASAVMHVALNGARPEEVDHLVMVLRPGRAVRLGQRGR